MNLCKYCGAPLKEGAKTCEYCGMPSEEGEEVQRQEEIHRQEEVQRQEEILGKEPEPGQRRTPSVKQMLWTGRLLLLFFNVILGILALACHNSSLSAFSSILLCFCLLSAVDFD